MVKIIDEQFFASKIGSMLCLFTGEIENVKKNLFCGLFIDCFIGFMFKGQG